MDHMSKVLIIEDDPSTSKVLSAYLDAAGYSCELVDNGDRALEVFDRVKPSIVLLDVVLPGKDGWTILKEIRAKSSCPVILLTALNQLEDRLGGFDAGADDYIGKPFQGKEVVARVQAVLRRTPGIISQDTANYGRLRINFVTREVFFDGQAVHLTPRDLSLLIFFARHPNQVFDRETLIQHVWGMDYLGSDRAVDLSIKRIRQSLPHLNEETGQIVTLRGLGYQFRVCKKA